MTGKQCIVACMIAMVVSACTPAVNNPIVNSAEMRAELTEQKRLLEQYHKNKGSENPTVPVFKTVWEYNAFFTSTGERILYAARDMCQHTMYRFGMQATTDWRKGKSLGKYRKNPRIYSLTESFPAIQAGMRIGDYVLKINGKSVLSDDHFITLHTDSYKNSTNTITYYSVAEGREKTVTLKSLETCRMEIHTVNEKMLNAYADGSAIFMDPALFDFLESKKYMTTVVAHEIAHNIMAHRTRDEDTFNVVSGLSALALALYGYSKNKDDFKANLNDNLDTIKDISSRAGNMANRVYSPTLESEADYVGAYLMVRAGYDINGIADTWRRMAMLRKNGNQLDDEFLSTHPSSPRRFVALKKTVQEIKERLKTESRESLMPIFTNRTLGDIKTKQKSLYN